MIDLPSLRRELHRLAEPSGDEQRTAARVADELRRLGAASLVTGLGGHGVLAAVEGRAPGRTVLLRSDLDALPLDDDAALGHASARPGTAHRCGHDGHMTLSLGVAERLARDPPERGRVLFLHQPSEEDGRGARAVLDDPSWGDTRPDVVLATHNLPGEELGAVVLRDGVFASASRGLMVSLTGRAAHASEPHNGRSPVGAAASLAQALEALPQQVTALEEGAQVTVVGLEAGGERFGTAPGAARVMATLRAHADPVVERLAEGAVDLARGLAAAHGLEVEVGWTDVFPSTPTDPRVVAVLERVAGDLGRPVVRREAPLPWSEDFGHFTARFPGALFGLGSGTEQPPLHGEGYDFPDALLEPGVTYIEAAVRALLTD